MVATREIFPTATQTIFGRSPSSFSVVAGKDCGYSLVIMTYTLLIAGLGFVSGMVGGVSYILADNTPGHLSVWVLLSAVLTATLVSVAVFKLFGKPLGFTYMVTVLLGVVPGYFLAIIPFIKHR